VGEAIIALRGLLERNKVFTEVDISNAFIQWSSINSDSVFGDFINEECSMADDAEVASSALYERFEKYCYRNDIPSISEIDFFRQLRKKLPALETTRNANKTGRRGYIGIMLKAID